MHHIKKIIYTATAITLTMLAACGKGGNGQSLTEEEKARISMFSAINDSINQMSGNVKQVVEDGMRKAADSTAWCEYAIRLAKIYINENNADSALACINKVRRFIDKQPQTPRNNLISGMAREYEAGWRQLTHNNMETVQALHKQAYDRIMKSDDKSYAPDIMANLGDAYFLQNDMPQAASYYRRALFLADSLQLPKRKSSSLYISLARIYESLGDMNEAERFYKQSELYINAMPQNMQVFLLSSFGSYYYKTRQYRKSIGYFNRMEKYVRATEGEDCFDMALCRINSADVYLNLGDTERARRYLDMAEPVFRKYKINVGVYYANTIRMGILLKKKDYAAIRRMLDSEDIDTREIEFSIQKIRNAYLREYYVATGDPAAALRNKLSEDQANDSVARCNSYMRASEVMQRFTEDTLAMHHEKILAEKEHKATEARNTIILLAAGIIILALALTLWWMYARKQQVSAKMERFMLRLENTRNRISPHFIFNILNNRIYSAGQKEKDELMTLAQLIRKSLDISCNTFIKLSEELDFVRKYVEVQSYILRPDFSFSLNTTPDIGNTYIPAMSIQILAENAIKHGLKGLDRQQKLTIDVIKEKDLTTITVTDNGRGFDSTRGGGGGLGMNIIRQTISAVNKRSKKNKMDMNIRNLKEADGKIAGCQVSITLKGNIDTSKF